MLSEIRLAIDHLQLASWCHQSMLVGWHFHFQWIELSAVIPWICQTCSWSGSCAGQLAVTIITCCCALSSWIFLPSTITSSYSINDHRCHQNSGPGFHLLPSRLLQLFFVRYVRRPFSEDPVDPERRRTSGHRNSSMRSHHAGAASIALASCSSMSQLQGWMSGAPVASGSDTCIPGWRHPTCDGHWSPSATFSCRPQMHSSFGDRSFSAAGLHMWNSLLPHLRQDMNFACLQLKLKTFLFGC